MLEFNNTVMINTIVRLVDQHLCIVICFLECKPDVICEFDELVFQYDRKDAQLFSHLR